MYESNQFVISNWEIQSLHKRKRFRIHGDVIGTMHDVTSLLLTLEDNYNFIFAYEKIRIEGVPQFLLSNNKDRDFEIMCSKLKCLQEKRFSELISADEYITINKISFSSPGFWEVIGSCNPLRQIRKYINERHERQKDKKYKEAEIDEKNLNNDMIRLSITKEMINQLKSISMQDQDINNIIRNSYQNLSLLDSHIDNNRITYIEELDIDDDIEKLKQYMKH